MTYSSLPQLSVSVPAAVREILAANTIVLACHVNPDGDALGSLLGMGLALETLGKTVTYLSADGVPEIYRFLPGADRVQQTTDLESFDMALVLDSGDLSRVGAAVLPAIGRARKLIDIDHHVTSGAFGDIQVINSQAASTAEIVHTLLSGLGVTITQDIATCLFTGVITDTGSFRFQNVTPNTFYVAADLLEAGAPPAFISERVFDNRTFSATLLLGFALSSLSSLHDGRVVWAHVRKSDFDVSGATDADTEGIVNFVRGVRGAVVGVLFREAAGDQIRISLRSQEHVDVAEIAAKYGGGGHKMASGCSYKGTLEDAERLVLADVSAAVLKASGS